MLFCVGLSFGCWSWNVDNSILIIIFNTYFTVLITFWYRHLICLLQVIVVATRNSRVFIPSVTTRKVVAKNCEEKDLPSHLWCNSCSELSNRSTREKIKSCCCPWVLKDDSKLHQIKHYYVIQEHFNNVLYLPSKKNKARQKQNQPSSIRI